jgi:hypothetical protein
MDEDMQQLPPRTSSLAIDSSGRTPLVPGDVEGMRTITGLGSVTQELEVSPSDVLVCVVQPTDHAPIRFRCTIVILVVVCWIWLHMTETCWEVLTCQTVPSVLDLHNPVLGTFQHIESSLVLHSISVHLQVPDLWHV